MQLTFQATWSGTDDEILEAQGQAFQIISDFVIAECVRNENVPEGIDCEDCMGCGNLVWKDGVLGCNCCGSFIPVPGQSGNGNQPGAPSPIPPPGGGQQTYPGCFNAANSLLLPPLVSTGDVINVTSASGAWNDPDHDLLLWRTPNGDQFLLGVDVPGTEVFVGTDPLPSAAHMSLIALIDGNYYPLEGGPLTVPGGISNAQVVILTNDSNRADDQGNVCLTVQVTNNRAATWCINENFGLSAWGWAAIPQDLGCLPGTWTAGTGWTQDDCTTSGTPSRAIFIGLTGPITHLDSIDVTFDFTTGLFTGGAGAAQFEVYVDGSPVYTVLFPSLPNGHQTIHVPIGSSVASSLRILIEADVASSPLTGAATLEEVILNGSGSSMPPGTPC